MGHNGQSSSNGGGGSSAAMTKHVGHPTVNKQFEEVFYDDFSGFDADGAQMWIEDHSSLGAIASYKAGVAINKYTDGKYSDMHNGDASVKDLIEQADKALTDPKMPIYSGEIYRGVSFFNKGMTARQQIDAILQKGVWKEPGLSSFSSSKGVAQGFASDGDIGCVIHVLNNKSGVPIGHMSQYVDENEVLINSKVARNGWKIKSHSWNTNGTAVDIYVVEP